MKIKVYIEYANGYTDKVATFYDEETYILCLPELEKEAEKNRGIVTESITYN